VIADRLRAYFEGHVRAAQSSPGGDLAVPPDRDAIVGLFRRDEQVTLSRPINLPSRSRFAGSLQQPRLYAMRLYHALVRRPREDREPAIL
jgi:hypothetical protein